MIVFIAPLFGQSNYDLSLKATGSLDNIVDFLNKNKVSDINAPSKINYLYDTNSIISKIISGKNYQTLPNNGRFFDPTFFDSTFFE